MKRTKPVEFAVQFAYFRDMLGIPVWQAAEIVMMADRVGHAKTREINRGYNARPSVKRFEKVARNYIPINWYIVKGVFRPYFIAPDGKTVYIPSPS